MGDVRFRPLMLGCEGAWLPRCEGMEETACSPYSPAVKASVFGLCYMFLSFAHGSFDNKSVMTQKWGVRREREAVVGGGRGGRQVGGEWLWW